MADTTLKLRAVGPGLSDVELKLIDNNDDTFSLSVGGLGALTITNPLGQDVMANSLPVVLASNQTAVPVADAGPSQTIVRTYTESADMTTAAALTAAPTTGQKIVATDLLISSDTAMNFKIQMETSGNVLAKVFLAVNSTATIRLRGNLKGDAVNKKLFGKASVSGNVAITAVYYSEA